MEHQGANPDTCRHRVIFAGATYGNNVEYYCLSCSIEIPDDFWVGRQFNYDPKHQQWVQNGRTTRRRTGH